MMLLHCCTYTTGTLHATVFVVGPNPEPFVFGAEDNPQSTPNGGADRVVEARISRPRLSLPLAEVDNRRQNKRRTGSNNVQSVVSWELSPHAHRRVHDYNARVPRFTEEEAVATRSLPPGECRITKVLLGFNYTDNVLETGTTWIPPDPHGAVGRSRLVVNSMMEVRRKDCRGSLVVRDGLHSFFAAYTEAFEAGARFFDPKVIYDEHTGRFVLVVLQRSFRATTSRIWLAVSKDETSDTAEDWHQNFFNSVVSIGGNKTWADYPGLEVDVEAVYITANMFRFSDDDFAGFTTMDSQ
jgi:hypothetical protein